MDIQVSYSQNGHISKFRISRTNGGQINYAIYRCMSNDKNLFKKYFTIILWRLLGAIFFCHDSLQALKMSTVLMLFKQLRYQLPSK